MAQNLHERIEIVLMSGGRSRVIAETRFSKCCRFSCSKRSKKFMFFSSSSCIEKPKKCWF